MTIVCLLVLIRRLVLEVLSRTVLLGVSMTLLVATLFRTYNMAWVVLAAVANFVLVMDIIEKGVFRGVQAVILVARLGLMGCGRFDIDKVVRVVLTVIAPSASFSCSMPLSVATILIFRFRIQVRIAFGLMQTDLFGVSACVPSKVVMNILGLLGQ